MTSVKQLVKDFSAMMASRSNPHGVTAAQLNSMSKEETDTLLNKYLGNMNFSIGKYGDKSWTPPNVLGSFEGGARYESKPYWAVCEEPDGSISMLENATNGVNANVYYTFFNKDSNGEWTLNATPQRYQPKWLNKFPGKRIYDLFSSNGQNVIWGDTWDTELKRTQRYVALTHGTLESGEHEGSIVAFGDPITGYHRFSRAQVCGDYVYFIEMHDAPNIRIARCKVSDVAAGTTITSEEMKNWTVTGINGTVTTVTDGKIKLASEIYARDPNVDALIYADTNATGYAIYDTNVQYSVANDKTGVIRVLQQLCFWVVSQKGQYGFADGVSMLIEIDTRNLTISVHPDTRDKARMVNVPGTDRVQATGIQAQLSRSVYGAPWGQMRGQMHLLSTGEFAKFKWSALGLGWFDIHKAAKSEVLTPFEQILPANMAFSDAESTKKIYRRFGSLIGTDLRPLGPCGYDKDMFSTVVTDPKDPSSPPRGLYVRVGTEGAYNGFDYDGYQGKFKGYRPTTKRKECYDTPVSGIAGFTALIKSGDPDGELARVTNIAGQVMTVSTGITQVHRNINMPDNQWVAVSGEVTTCQKSVFEPHFNRFYADAAPEIPVGQANGIAYELWVAPIGTGRVYRPIVTVYVLNSVTGIGVTLFYQAQCTAEQANYVGAITAITELKLLRKTVDSTCTSISLHDRHSGYVYERVENGVLQWTTIHPATRLLFGTTGGNTGRHLELVIPAGQEEYDVNHIRDRAGSAWYTGISPMGCVSKVGPVMWQIAMNAGSSGCAIYYTKRPVHKGMEHYWQNDNDTDDLNKYVAVASQVAQGYEVYFTDREQCLLKSVPYLIDPTTISLSDLGPNPENKRFNVHLRLVDGVVSYVITPDLNAQYDLYIGYILTNATQIETINIAKVVKLD
ncbi:hypothetical protein NRE35_004312 [Salmonella enterica]|nr:hypothetical protein [Salmonella enterica]